MKSICEDEIKKYCKKKLNNYFSILRISKVLSYKINPIKTWIQNIKKEKTMFIPNDLYCPIDLNSLNQTMYKIVRNFYNGIFHLSSSKEYTYFDLAKKNVWNKKFKVFKPINSKNYQKLFTIQKSKLFYQ